MKKHNIRLGERGRDEVVFAARMLMFAGDCMKKTSF